MLSILERSPLKAKCHADNIEVREREEERERENNLSRRLLKIHQLISGQAVGLSRDAI